LEDGAIVHTDAGFTGFEVSAEFAEGLGEVEGEGSDDTCVVEDGAG